MKRFVQPNTWQLDFTEPVADILGSERRTTIRQRLMKRLHKVFSKEPDTTPVINVHYSGARCTITVNANGIYVKAQEGTAYIGSGTSSIVLSACDPAGGAVSAVSIDSAVNLLLLSGTYFVP